MANRLDDIALEIRREIVKMALEAKTGHIATALSMVDILATLYFESMNIVDTANDKDNDSLIVSKGHGALAIYAALAVRGFIPREELAKYHMDGEKWTSFPHDPFCPGLFFASGSLGHGFSTACGAALAASRDGLSKNIYCILSDGECQEGSTWEAALFAAHHELSNLTVIIDYNKLQALGDVADVVGLEPFCDKWRSFGFETFDVDGHSTSELSEVFTRANQSDKPVIVVANTVKGKGLSFMEGKLDWHYLPIVDQYVDIAKAEVGL